MGEINEQAEALNKQIFDRDYSKEDYEKQFTIKTKKLIERFARVKEIYKDEPRIPDVFNDHMEQQIKRLNEAKEKLGEVIAPDKFNA